MLNCLTWSAEILHEKTVSNMLSDRANLKCVVWIVLAQYIFCWLQLLLKTGYFESNNSNKNKIGYNGSNGNNSMKVTLIKCIISYHFFTLTCLYHIFSAGKGKIVRTTAWEIASFVELNCPCVHLFIWNCNEGEFF